MRCNGPSWDREEIMGHPSSIPSAWMGVEGGGEISRVNTRELMAAVFIILFFSCPHFINPHPTPLLSVPPSVRRPSQKTGLKGL